MTGAPITDALQASDDPLEAPMWLKWRVGDDGRSIYAMPKGWPQEAGDMRVGRMFERQFAEEVVHAHNACLTNVQQPEFYEAESAQAPPRIPGASDAGESSLGALESSHEPAKGNEHA